MKIDIIDESFVFCDGLMCDWWLAAQYRCDLCPLFKIYELIDKDLNDGGC